MKTFLPFIILLVLLSACKKTAANTDDILPPQRAESVVMRESSGGITVWQLKAKTADFYDNKDVSMENPQITFDNDKKSEASLIAKKGTLKGDIITFTGSVVVRSKAEKLKLNTEKLFYNTKNKIAWTDVPFVLKRNGITVKGKAMKASDNFSNIEIFNQVTDLPASLKEF